MQAPRDENRIPALLGTSSSDGVTPVTIYADPSTHRLLVGLATGSAASGTFTSADSKTITVVNGIITSIV